MTRRRALMAKQETAPKATFVLLKGETGSATRTGQASYQVQSGDKITVKWYGLAYSVNPRTYTVFFKDGATAQGISDDYYWAYRIYQRRDNYPNGEANILIENGGTVWFSYDPASAYGCFVDRIEVTIW